MESLKHKNEETESCGSKTTLCLTYIRTSQQVQKEKARQRRLEIRGKPFKVHTSKPLFCNSNKVAFITFKDGKQITKYSTIACNSWTCPVCGPKRALYLKYYLRDVIQLNTLNRFITLTLDPKKIPAKYYSVIQPGLNTFEVNNTHEYITKLLNHFLVIIKRRYIKRVKRLLKYVWVAEFQKNGMAHLHIVVNQFLPIKLLRFEWKRIGGGAQMNIGKVRNLIGISNYIGNYIIKGLKGQYDYKTQSLGFKYNERRYSISRSCIRPPKNKIILLHKLPEDERNEYFKLFNYQEVYNALKSS